MSLLETSNPSFTRAEVVRIAAERFGLEGTAVDLGSERDQTFLIEGARDSAVMKIANIGQDPALLDLERGAIDHVVRVDPSLPVARPRGEAVLVDGPDGHHNVRLFERVHGHAAGPELGEGAVFDFAATHARLNLALRSFFHAAAGRERLWDLAQARGVLPLLEGIADAGRREIAQRVVERFEQRVAPRWHALRLQVVHGDFQLENVLLDECDRIAGIVDFGDCGYTSQAGDLAIALASLMLGRSKEDVFRIGRIAIDGYTSQFPLEPVELELLGDLTAVRLAMLVAITRWRARRYPDNAEYLLSWDDDLWSLLELFDRLGPDTVALELGAARHPAATGELRARRSRVMGALLTPLSYARPVHPVRGRGVWLYDADGRRLLDAYNNVPVVGHCHPRVTEAVVDQTRRLNSHSRYLCQPLVELAERLLTTMPPNAELDTVMLVNSGSEANDIAWRIATAVTGASGAIVTEHAYHGVTDTTARLSSDGWPAGYHPDDVARIAPCGSGVSVAEDVERALRELNGLAATFVDCAFTSDGIWTPSDDDLATLATHTRAAGGLLVADEVQAGHGRLGERLWAFAHYGLEPDFVTLGKPMGNGYPVAALITRRELVERAPLAGNMFSTFGGNPVAARAALAVLDVLDDERIIDRSADVGARLHAALRSLRAPEIVAVRGRGLIAGVELTKSSLAARLVDRLRDDGVLIGRTGKDGNVLKIRPPLVFSGEHVELLTAALERALAAEA